MLCEETVGEWIIKIRFKYDYAVNNSYMGGHKNNNTIWYRWKIINIYLLLYWCMFRCIHMTAEDSDQYKGYKSKRLFQYLDSVTRDATTTTDPMIFLIW